MGDMENVMEMETDSDEDSEIQLHDLKQLTAVLEADEPSTSECTSQYSASVSSVPSTSYRISLELSRIDSALALNRLMDEKYKRLEKILTNRLRDCRQRLKDNLSGVDCSERQETFRYFNCGKPYFKDRHNFPAPDNEDTILMEKSGMYDFSQVISVPGWTVKDKSNFISVLHKMSQEIRKSNLISEMAQIRRENKSKGNIKAQNKIAIIQKEIDAIGTKSLAELALPIDEEYDWETLANKLNRRHTPHEYQALWKLFFHPSINKNSWNKSEHRQLQIIACERNAQDWDEIAKILNTGRTGYQCFVYFRTNMANSFSGRRWSTEEVEYLKRLIDYYKEDNYIPWGKVAAAMENRTKIQIYNKYIRLVERRKGRFLPEEDAVILNCIDKFGTNFRRMINYLPGRSMIQLRSRYNVLSKMRVSTVWTVEDDRKLLQIMANQDSNASFSSATQYFPGRDRIHIRTRYLTLVKWMKSHPQSDILYAPRRAARRLTHGQATDNLNKAIENLKNRMQSEVNTKKSRKITEDSPEEDIEDAIMATLFTEMVKEEELKNCEPFEDIILADNTTVSHHTLNLSNLRKTLIFLNASLNKEKFCNSYYSEQYEGLANPEQEVCLVKVKSYSKKNSVKTINVKGIPDIWGNITLGPVKYVLPPNYATITGCKVLMNHVSLRLVESDPINVGLIVRRNCILKEQFNLLMDRFNSLFLWPMLLSNEGPKVRVNKQTNVQDAYQSRYAKKKKIMSEPSGVTIPVYRSTVVNETIDLEESDVKDDVTIKEIFMDDEIHPYQKFAS